MSEKLIRLPDPQTLLDRLEDFIKIRQRIDYVLNHISDEKRVAIGAALAPLETAAWNDVLEAYTRAVYEGESPSEPLGSVLS